jgi:hypothetical protein|tara:strand:+ start:683 stop:844 length:162 start_codon:yes stop_codon:yes gene_type:complete
MKRNKLKEKLIEKFIKTQGKTAMELLDFGNQREKAEGMGMLRVLKDLEKEIKE